MPEPPTSRRRAQCGELALNDQEHRPSSEAHALPARQMRGGIQSAELPPPRNNAAIWSYRLSEATYHDCPER